MDYLNKKWKIWYNFLDVNYDGKIFIEDVEEFRNKFINFYELVGDKVKGVQVNFEDWWNKYIFRIGVGKEILESEFVQQLMEVFKKDKVGFIKEM